MTNLLNLQPAAVAEYQEWLNSIKQRIVSVRLRMALAANRELIEFYWELGALIAHRQTQSQWGDKLIAQLSTDLQKAFPDVKGLSASNLKYCLRFFQFYANEQGISAPADAPAPFGQQPVDQMADRCCLAPRPRPPAHRTGKSAGNTSGWMSTAPLCQERPSVDPPRVGE